MSRRVASSRHAALFTIGFGALLVVSGVVSTAESLPPLRIMVRIHDAYGVPAADRMQAQTVASALLLPAGVAIAWKDCDSNRAPARASDCSTPLEPVELVMRLIDAPRHQTSHPLGYSLIDVERRQGALATVYVDRVKALAAAAAANPGLVLGRTMAHEIVHLLLGSTAHTPYGLMRAVWHHTDLRKEDPRDWTLGAKETTDLRSNVQSRLTQATPTLLADRDASPRPDRARDAPDGLQRSAQQEAQIE